MVYMQTKMSGSSSDTSSVEGKRTKKKLTVKKSRKKLVKMEGKMKDQQGKKNQHSFAKIGFKISEECEEQRCQQEQVQWKSRESDTDSESSKPESDEKLDSHLVSVNKKKQVISASRQTSQESNDEEVEDDEEDSLVALRKELSSMPFQDLQKLKEKIGTKLYNQTMFSGGSQISGKRNFKRENKNRPQELSSKRRVPLIREVIPVKKKVHRDPRFDDLSGEYNETYFNKLYGFIDDLKLTEKEKLEKKLKREKNPEKIEEFKYLISRLNQQQQAKIAKLKNKEIDNQIKQKERALVKEGKSPFYLKKSEKRKLELAEKYKELKKSGKVDKYLMKKRKKTASKDRRKLPKVQP